MQSQTATLTRLRYSLTNFPEVVALISFLLVFVIFAVSAEHFLTPLALSNILSFASIMGIIAIGFGSLMIAGEFDLSVGSNFAVASFVFALTLNAGVAPLPAMLFSILISALLGAINGLIVISSGIPSFITTLGTMLAYRGVARALGGGLMVKYTEATPQLFFILNGAVDSLNQRFAPAANFRTSILWFFVLAIVMSIVLMRTRFGNWIFAVGGNAEAAVAQGVPVRWVKLGAFTLTGLLVGLASVMNFAHRGSVDPLRGYGWELIVVAACVIGGVRLDGGFGTIIGPCIGMLMLQMLEQGLVLLGVPVQVFRAVAGLILMIAVILNTYLGRQE
jgi:simple sugar transport system permease protein